MTLRKYFLCEHAHHQHWLNSIIFHWPLASGHIRLWVSNFKAKTIIFQTNRLIFPMKQAIDFNAIYIHWSNLIEMFTAGRLMYLLQHTKYFTDLHSLVNWCWFIEIDFYTTITNFPSSDNIDWYNWSIWMPYTFDSVIWTWDMRHETWVSSKCRMLDTNRYSI